jgi:para-nitrobenzyl esterase
MNGMLDMVTALRWVQANGAQFGGDTSLVTISGESAGGEAVCSLLVSPLAKKLFVRAIIESGPCLTGSTGWGPHDQDQLIAVSTGLAQNLTGLFNPTLADLRAVKDARKFVTGPTIKDSIDGYFMPVQPSEFFASGHLNALDVMLGGNSYDGLASYTVPYIISSKTRMISPAVYGHEMKASWGDDAAAVEKLYNPQERYDGNTNAAFIQPDGDAGVVCPTMEMARQLTAAGGRAYVFHFDYKGCSDLTRFRVPSDYASHASEIPYVWGFGSAWCYALPGEERLTLVMQEFWGSFTRAPV